MLAFFSVGSMEDKLTFTLPSFGGREASLKDKAKNEANQIETDGKAMAQDAKAGVESIAGQAKQKAVELKEKVVK